MCVSVCPCHFWTTFIEGQRRRLQIHLPFGLLNGATFTGPALQAFCEVRNQKLGPSFLRRFLIFFQFQCIGNTPDQSTQYQKYTKYGCVIIRDFAAPESFGLWHSTRKPPFGGQPALRVHSSYYVICNIGYYYVNTGDLLFNSLAHLARALWRSPL